MDVDESLKELGDWGPGTKHLIDHFDPSPCGYEFGHDSDCETLPDTDSQLMLRLSSVVAKLERQRPIFDGFEAFRLEYDTVSIEMNRRRKVAPSFRPRLRPPPLAARHRNDDIHSLDLQVIDLHWWFLNGGTEDASKTLAPLYHYGEFPFTLAQNFALLRWPARQKVAAMNLTAEDQWAMAALRDKDLATRRRRFEKRALAISKAMLGLARRDGRFAGVTDDWRLLAFAEQIAADVGAYTGRTVVARDVARFYNWMTGKELRRQTIQTKLKRLSAKKHLVAKRY